MRRPSNRRRRKVPAADPREAAPARNAARQSPRDPFRQRPYGGAHAGDKPGEITITRRLFRSGESEYLIDGRQARLRDIQDIFMGTGLGPESYAIIEQGRIGQILSSKPAGSPRGHRRSRGHHEIQEPAPAGRSQARKREAEPRARVRHSRRGHAPGKFAEAPGRKSEAISGTEGRTRRPVATVLAGRYITLKRKRRKRRAALEGLRRSSRTSPSRLPNKDAERQQAQEIFYALEAQLTEARRQLAEMNVEAERTKRHVSNRRCGRRPRIEQRMTRAEQETGGSGSAARRQRKRNGRRWPEAPPSSSARCTERATGLIEKNQTRDAIQVARARGEKTIEASRSS